MKYTYNASCDFQSHVSGNNFLTLVGLANSDTEFVATDLLSIIGIGESITVPSPAIM
jgi:hypothetical protein